MLRPECLMSEAVPPPRPRPALIRKGPSGNDRAIVALTLAPSRAMDRNARGIPPEELRPSDINQSTLGEVWEIISRARRGFELT
jgi:hypothetical protein